MKNIPELVCPAGNLPALKTAVDNGADTVYMGLKDATNARNFPGLNFDQKSIIEGIRYAHDRGRHVLMAINTYAQAGQVERWRRAIDTAADLGADAVIVADPAVMAYACEKHPNLRLHMSVQGSATNYEAINLMKDLFGIRRAVLPRVLTIDQVQHVIENTDVEIEVFGFGSLCVMVEGRCILSSYATGESPNMQGVCSPAKAVALGAAARQNERAAQPGDDRPVQQRRTGRLPHAVQRPFRSERRNVLRAGRADQPERAGSTAAAHQNRRGGGEGGRPPAQPDVHRAGYAHIAAGFGRSGGRPRALPRNPRMGRGFGQGVRRQPKHAGRI